MLALEMLYSTGIRVGELTSITLNDLDLYKGQIRIKGKGHRERKVFIPDQELMRLIDTYMKVRNRLFPTDVNTLLLNSRGKAASTQFIRKLLRELSHKCGLEEHATPHMCRHSTATELLNAGVDIRFVQKLMGHQSITTTQRYTHVSDEELRNQITAAALRGGLKMDN
ncbi:tyrosine-type recombinase/integrase [Oceanospirillum sediminis]|nr:tyrosine-type recombinase/integrase [Oceanospirillum sediminis]